MIESDGYLSGILVARRLLMYSEQIEARRAGKKVKIKNAKEAMEEEQALLSGPAKSRGVTEQKTAQSDNNVRIKLSDLIRRLEDVKKNPDQVARSTTRETVVVAASRRETEININVLANEPVEGLVVRNRHLAETDRYQFEFQDGTTFKITDKWSGKSTTIWGDPHVDTSDQQGTSNGEFSDLKTSDTHTTLQLEDGTRVTFTALDRGVIEQVDIFKDNQHLTGIGAASASWDEQNGLFASRVDNDASQFLSSTPIGDIVYAGGDGNDWYDAAGQMIWGQTTGSKPTRPYAFVEMTVCQREEQFFMVHSVERQA